MEIISKIIHMTDDLDVMSSIFNDVENIGIMYKVNNIAILPYTKINDTIDTIGIIKINNIFQNREHTSVIIESECDCDDTPLDTAIRGLCKHTGYNITDDSKWTFLKDIYTSNNINSSHICYAVDITGATKEDESLDLKLVSISEIILGNNSLAISILIKLYHSLYGNFFSNLQHTI